MEKTKNNWGGKREGAGRKRMGDELKKNITLRISPSAIHKLERLAAKEGVSKGVFFEELIKKL